MNLVEVGFDCTDINGYELSITSQRVKYCPSCKKEDQTALTIKYKESNGIVWYSCGCLMSIDSKGHLTFWSKSKPVKK